MSQIARYWRLQGPMGAEGVGSVSIDVINRILELDNKHKALTVVSTATAPIHSLTCCAHIQKKEAVPTSLILIIIPSLSHPLGFNLGVRVGLEVR